MPLDDRLRSDLSAAADEIDAPGGALDRARTVGRRRRRRRHLVLGTAAGAVVLLLAVGGWLAFRDKGDDAGQVVTTEPTPGPDEPIPDATPGPDEPIPDATPGPDEPVPDASPGPDEPVPDASAGPDEPVPVEPDGCATAEPPAYDEATERLVSVWFPCGDRLTQTWRVSPFDEEAGIAVRWIDALVAGPTPEEAERGFTTSVPADWAEGPIQLFESDHGVIRLPFDLPADNPDELALQLLLAAGTGDHDGPSAIELGCATACVRYRLDNDAAAAEQAACPSASDIVGDIVAEADYDGDGLVDRYVNLDGPAEAIVFGDGTATFAHGGGSVPEIAEYLGAIDLDGDGVLELWLDDEGNTARSTTLYRLVGCSLERVRNLEASSELLAQPLTVTHFITGNAARYSTRSVRCEQGAVVLISSDPVVDDRNGDGTVDDADFTLLMAPGAAPPVAYSWSQESWMLDRDGEGIRVTDRQQGEVASPADAPVPLDTGFFCDRPQ